MAKDQVTDIIIDAANAAITKQILWNGGSPICAACKGTQGLPVKLYSVQEAAAIHTFLETVNEKKLLAGYDYEKMLDDGVYKPTDPERKDELTAFFIKVRELFAKAHRQQMLVLKTID